MARRLLKAFYRSEEPDPELTERSEADPASPSRRTFEERLEEAQSDWSAFLCFDVEATCRGGKEFDWPNEIIVREHAAPRWHSSRQEFPVVLLKWVDVPLDTQDKVQNGHTETAEEGSRKRKRLERVDTFHSYVKPTWQPVLSDFCTSLTGITQVSRVLASSPHT
jgi:hypothetical protein